jgi:hypothetical protein
MQITLHAPQITFLILMTLAVINHTAHHGESREPYNGPAALLDAVVTTAILYWGGFFG